MSSLINLDIKNIIEYMLHVFEECNMQLLKMKTYLVLSTLGISEFSLHDKLYFIQLGYDMADSLKNIGFLIKFEQQRENLLKKVEEYKAHKILLLKVRTSKVILQRTDVRKDLWIKDALEKFAGNIRVDLKRERFSKNSFISLHRIKSSCKYLLLDFDVDEVDELPLEKDELDLKNEYLTEEEFEAIREEKEMGSLVDVIVLLNSYGSSHASMVQKYFSHLDFKVFIYFDGKALEKTPHPGDKFNSLQHFFIDNLVELMANPLFKGNISKIRAQLEECKETSVEQLLNILQFSSNKAYDPKILEALSDSIVFKFSDWPARIDLSMVSEGGASFKDLSQDAWNLHISHYISEDLVQGFVKLETLRKEGETTILGVLESSNPDKKLIESLAFEIGTRNLFSQSIVIDCSRESCDNKQSFRNLLKAKIVPGSHQETMKDWIIHHKDCLFIFLNFGRSIRTGNFDPSPSLLKVFEVNRVMTLVDIEQKEQLSLFSHFEII